MTLTKSSLMNRVAIGKAVGFVIGVVGFIILPYMWPDVSYEFRFGILFWYATVGAVIGVFGVWNRHPVFYFPMPWFVRAPIIGAWMNFVLVLFAEPQFSALMIGMLGHDSPYTSAYWFVLEGAVIGGLIGWTATHFAGEGPATMGHKDDVPV